MSYITSYNDPSKTREQHDEQAINDIREYLGSKEKFDLFVDAAEKVNDGEGTIQSLNLLFGFAGIRDRPFHAFCRKYALEKYKEWLRADIDGEQYECDEQGFIIEATDPTMPMGPNGNSRID